MNNEFLENRKAHITATFRLAKELPLSSELRRPLCEAVGHHDIGYFPEFMVTGFHPIDGFLKAKDFDLSEEICLAILYHTNAKELCPQHLLHYYIENPMTEEAKLFYDVVTYCDTRVDGKGNRVTVQERYEDIEKRYGYEHDASKIFRHNMDYYKKLDYLE